jgi:NADH-quinone oxidoreductase subunit N
LSAIFIGILYINTNNARIFILELPFLIGLMFFIFLVSACAYNFLFLFILMEIITLAIVVTVALYFVAIGPRLVRAAIKFFILNLFITTLYLLGVALLLYNMPVLDYYTLSYLALLSQWFTYDSMYLGLYSEEFLIVFKVVMVFIFLPLCFKLTLAPFSIWVVNVYAHLPQFFLLILLTFYKIIYSLIFIKLVLTSMDLIPHLQDVWSNSLYVFVLPSLFVGCLAFRTQDLGQVLAYTTVSNLGYVLSGFLVATELSIQYSLIYLVVYSIQLIALFVIFIILHKKHKVSNLNQLFLVKHYSKVYYYSLVFIFFSLAGVPPLAGFFTKYFLFLQVYTSGMYTLAIAGLVSGFIMSIVYLQIALQLVLVKRNNYQSLYFELTKSNSVAYNHDFMLSKIIYFFTFAVVGSQLMNVLFFFMLPVLAKTLAGVYSFVFLLV